MTGPRSLRWLINLIGCTLLPFWLAACGTMPPLEQQYISIQRNDFRVHHLTRQAFVDMWGPAEYTLRQMMQFFPLEDGSYKPRTRVPVGEIPPGWNTGVVYEPAVFLAYPNQSALVVFVDDILVYHETLSPQELHALGRTWAYENRYNSSLQGQASR